MTTFSIGPNPLQIVGAGVDNQPLTVQNSGAVSIYISADPGVSSTVFEYKIDAGGDFVWPPGKPLSVCTGKNVVGQISFGGTGEVHVNSGSTNVTGSVTINGSVPISGPVTVSGTVALSAGSTIAISGPVAIAGTVPITGNVNIAGGTVALSGPVAISGGVSVTGSTVNVGTPVKLANNVTLIANFSMTIANAVTVLPLQGPFDISPYASVILRIFNNAGYSAPTSNNWMDILLTTSGAAGSTAINPQFLTTTGGTQYIQIPVTGTLLSVNVTTHINGTMGTGFFSFVLLGTGETLTKIKYLSQGDGMVGNLPQGGVFAINALSPIGNVIATRNGDAMINLYSNSGTVQSQMVMQIIDNGNPKEMYSALPALSNAGNLVLPNMVKFPLRPIQYYITGNAGMNASLAIVQDG